MKKILILQYYKSIVDGVMTSIIDTYLNLRKYQRIYFNIICPELYLLEENDYYDQPLDQTQVHQYVEGTGVETIPLKNEPPNADFLRKVNMITTGIPFLKFNRNFSDYNLYHCVTQDKKKFEADLIICSARLLYEIVMGADIEIKCDKLIVLDSLDTYRSKIGVFPNIDDASPTDNCIYLSNPATFRETKYEQIEWYHKLNKERLVSCKQAGRISEVYNFKRAGKDKTKTESGHFENIGKGLFEHLWFKKDVHYSTDGMYMRDGMWYYLNLFGIDGEKDQPISLSPDDIHKHLFFHDDDPLLKELL
jgi:hypothetical protein